MHLTSHITHSNGYAPYIAYYRSNGFDQRFRKLKPKPKLNPPNAHRSQIKICEKTQTQNVQFRFMPNAFRILKPIQKSSKRVWVFRNTGANAFAKNQMRLAYEDKRDLYCTNYLEYQVISEQNPLPLLLPRSWREPTSSRTPRLHSKQGVSHPTCSTIYIWQ